MPDRSPGAHIVRRRLGTGLRRLREKADIRLEAAATELECSPAKISRLENGQSPAKLWDVRILLDLYGVQDPAIRARYESWARGTKDEGWWESDADLTDDDGDRYIAAETAAARVRMFCTPVPPAVLQTSEYSRAHLRILNPHWPDADVDRFVGVRRARQDPLLAGEFAFDAVIDESALHRRVGSTEIHLAQLRWLHDIARRGLDDGLDLEIRILPFSAGPGRGLSPFTIFEPRNSDLDPVTAFVEETMGGSWVEEGNVTELVEILDELRHLSLDAAASAELLGAIARSP